MIKSVNTIQTRCTRAFVQKETAKLASKDMSAGRACSCTVQYKKDDPKTKDNESTGR